MNPTKTPSIALALLFALASVPEPATGDPITGDQDHPIPLDEVVVTAPRIETELVDVPTSLTVITREEIDQSRAASVVELLRSVTASNVLDETGNGNTQHVAFRAYESWRAANSVVMVNGIPSRTFFNVPIEPASVERIEIIRGPSSVVYGGRVGGGVINIVTRTGGSKGLAILPQFSMGSFGLRKTGLSLGGTTDRLNYQVSALHKRGDGFRDRNSRYEVLNFSTRVVQQLDERSVLSMNLLYWDGDTEFPGGFATLEALKVDRTAVFIDPTSEWPQRNLSGNVAYEGRFSWAQSAAANFFFSLRDQTQILDFRSPGAPDPDVRKSLRDRSNLGFVARYRHQNMIGSVRSTILVGTHIEWDDFDNARFQAPGGIITGAPLSDQSTGNLITALYALEELRLTHALQTTFGLRYERIDNRSTDNLVAENSGTESMGVLIPAIGFEYVLAEDLRIYANSVRTFSPPQPQQLLDPVQGNRDLEPAISFKHELGAKLTPTRSVELSMATYYENYAQDITRVTVQSAEGRTQQLQNVGKTNRRGLEGEIRVRMAEGRDGTPALSLFVNGTLQKGTFSAHPNFEGNTLPYVPGRLVNFGARYGSSTGLSISLGGNYVGSKWGDNNNRTAFQMPGYSILNSVIGYEGERFSVFAKMDNLLDEVYAVQYKPTLHGFLPGAPRNFEIGFVLKN